MANYSYLDALDKMRSGGSTKKSTRGNRGGGGSFATAAKPASRSTTRATTTSMPRSDRGGGGSFAAPAPAASRGTRGGGGSFGGTAPVRSAPPVRNNPPVAPRGPVGTPLAVTQKTVTPWNYSSVAPSATGVFGGSVADDLVTPEAPVMTDEEYLPTDSVYVSEAAGINADVDNLINQLKRQRASYDIDFGQALRNLGWDLGEQGMANPGMGSWDQADMTGAYGAAYNNLQNDFAGRGMLTSSFYGRDLEDLLSSFENQRTDLIGSRQRQFDDWTAEETNAENQRRQGLDRARASALARRAAGLGLAL